MPLSNTANAKKFRSQINKSLRSIEKKGMQVVIKIARELFSSIVRRTPVDTGRARGNWFISSGTPVLTSQPLTFDPTGKARISDINRFTAQFSLGQTLWLANNLDYIGKLEAGHSPQARGGMIGPATGDALAVI